MSKSLCILHGPGNINGENLKWPVCGYNNAICKCCEIKKASMLIVSWSTEAPRRKLPCSFTVYRRAYPLHEHTCSSTTVWACSCQ